MRHKTFHIFIIFGVVLIILMTKVYANDCPDKEIESSAQKFITQYNEDLRKGDKSKIKQYFFEKPDKESIEILSRTGPLVSQKPIDEKDLEYMVDIGKQLAETVDKIEFLEMNILSKEPLIIEVSVRDKYKPEYAFFLPLEELYILKNIGSCKWKIIDITMPGLP